MHDTYAVKVELSANWCIHDMFYVEKLNWHLEKFNIQSEIKLLSVIKIDNYNKWKVNTILNHRLIKCQWKYLIKWIEFCETIWELLSNLENVMKKINKYCKVNNLLII